MVCKKIIRRSFRLFVYTMTAVIILLIAWATLHNALEVLEKKIHIPPGEMVDVNGEKIHVFSKGRDSRTIVLLSGLGTEAPVLDFMPLINELSKTFKVVVVEYFGYGWSSISKKPRTIENIVDETRLALHKAGIVGPYILMPHSISGIYSLYYVNTYPDEIEAIIGIDCSIPDQILHSSAEYPEVPESKSWLSVMGFARLESLVNPDTDLPEAPQGTYSDENLKLIKTIAIWNKYNSSLIAEVNEIENNFIKVTNMSYPDELPVLFFTAEIPELQEYCEQRLSLYRFFLKKVKISKIIVLEGPHYLHWTCSKQIAKSAYDFIKMNMD